MSESLKKLRSLEERRKEFKKRHPELTEKDIAELDRQAEEARRKEERTTHELMKAMSNVSKRSIKLLKGMMKDEKEAPETYREIAKALEVLDEPVLANTLRRIAMEEEMHYAHIRDIVEHIEKKYKK